MGKWSRFAILLLGTITLVAIDTPAIVDGAHAPVNNVATQWNSLYMVIACKQQLAAIPPLPSTEPNIIFAQLHLAQWHALIALENTEASTTEEVVVAFASHKILSNYFPFEQVGAIDPLLNTQLKQLRVSHKKEKLGRQLGEAVALDLIAKRLSNSPARAFALQALKEALDEEYKSPRPGVYRYLNNTPAGRDEATFIFYNLPISQPYVVPQPEVFIKAYLSELKPPKVPSDEFDEEYEKVVNLGRVDWPGRTRVMNETAAFTMCGGPVGPPFCFPEHIWATAASLTLPTETSLYDTVVVFAKLSVAMHDVLIVLTTLQYGFWFWRPEMAFKAGDPHHKPVPNWTPFGSTPPHAEYPSGTVSSYAAAATILEEFIGADVPFTLPGVTYAQPCRFTGPVPDKKFDSFRDLVKYGQVSRIFSGAHWNISVEDAVKVGGRVGNYVQANWGLGTPSGVRPNPTYLDVFAELPKVQTDFSPVRFEY